MKLIDRPNIGTGIHRSGWIGAIDSLIPMSNGKGVLLDDCVEYTFLFGPDTVPHDEPWVGIFHFPHHVNSPFNPDWERNSALAVLRNKQFLRSLPNLVGGIALASSLAEWLEYQLGVPFKTIKHPTELGVPTWSAKKAEERKLMLQLGWHLRNTRAIFHQQPMSGWQYARIAMYQNYQRQRDWAICQALPLEINSRVEEWKRLENDVYDKELSQCVVLSQAFGVAACNVIVECIARGTPLLINRCRETEEYLGKDYTLYLGESVLSQESLCLAHNQLLRCQGPWLKYEKFARDVHKFVETVGNKS